MIGLCSLIVLALLAVPTPKEKQLLVERFDKQYRDNIARTRRFVPRISN